MPFLDEWAKGGVDFENAYTPNPTCMPARVSMMTGRYSECHQVRTNHNLQDALYTEDLLDVLKKNGYVTALCGKIILTAVQRISTSMSVRAILVMKGKTIRLPLNVNLPIS